MEGAGREEKKKEGEKLGNVDDGECSWMGQFARFEVAIWRFLGEIGRDCCREAGGAEFFDLLCLFVAHFAWTRLYEVRRGTYLRSLRALCGCGVVGRLMTRLVHDLCIDVLSGEVVHKAA